MDLKLLLSTATYWSTALEVPVVALQPTSQTVLDGATATFTAAFSGADSVQWQVNTGSGFANISGATSESYTTGTLSDTEDGYQYRCVATNSKGSTTTNSVYLAVFAENFGLNPYTGFYEAIPVTGSADPTDDSRMIYVSNAGNDTTGDGSIGAPYATYTKAYTRVRDGYPDWVLFKCGDTWTDVTFAPKKDGLDENNRIVFTSYGSGARPLFKSSRILIQGGSSDHAAYQWYDRLHFYEPINDPSAPEFGIGTAKSHAVRMLDGTLGNEMPINWIMLHDCVFEYYGTNIQIQHVESPDRTDTMEHIDMHRCVIAHSTSDVNTFWTGVSDFFITENAYVDAYWDNRRVFEHHIYLKYCNYQNTDAIERTGLIKRNVFIRAANHAIKNSGDSAAANFDLTVDDNWLFLCGMGLCGHSDTLDFDDTLETTHFRHRYENNVVQEVAKTLNPGGSVQSQFGIATNGTDIRLKNNLFSNNDTTEAESGTGVILAIDPAALNRRITVDGNKVANWLSSYFDSNAAYISNSDAVLCEDYTELNGGIVDASGATDPDRDLLQYNNDVLSGSATTRDEALVAFETAIESRSARTWNPLYGAESMNEWWRTGADMTYAAPEPFVTAAWEFVGVDSGDNVTSGDITLTEPAGVAEGDLLIAIFDIRGTPVFSTPTGWTLVTQQNSGNTTANSTTSVSSGQMFYIVRGASAPNLTFARTGGDLAIGTIVAYRGVDSASPLVTSSSVTTDSSQGFTTQISSVTTSNSGDLIVVGACGSRPGSLWSNYIAATDPATGSGSGSADTDDPLEGEWQERFELASTSAGRGILGIGDAIRATSGATGTISITNANPGGHAVLVGVFKLG